MIQNHLLQIFCLIAMEAPVSLNDDEVRNKKVDVLRAIRPILPERVHEHAVSGQYGSGWIEGEHVKGYRSEPRVAKGSATETFAALRLFIDNWRWQNVPFYMRTGKRLPSKISEVAIQFRNIPHQTFPPRCLEGLASQPADHRHSTGGGNIFKVPEQVSGSGHAAVAGHDAVLLSGNL